MQRNHNPRVGGSSPSSATIYLNVINVLQRLKNDFEAIFALHTSSTLFHSLSETNKCRVTVLNTVIISHKLDPNTPTLNTRRK